MDINITLLERYFEKIGYPVTVFSSTEIPGLLIIQAGKPEMEGSNRVLIDTIDLLHILELNKIIGEGSAVRKILDDKKIRDPQIEINNLIYELLVNYIYQMLKSSGDRLFNKDIIPLPKHQGMYF
ncbi:MAG: hypothetical protein K0R26_20 [Bacteroidota bacterium]|jgi:hypothetical protein|nr:hypothetical protein [Bacteroidota bacterium]